MKKIVYCSYRIKTQLINFRSERQVISHANGSVWGRTCFRGKNVKLGGGFW